MGSVFLPTNHIKFDINIFFFGLVAIFPFRYEKPVKLNRELPS